MKTKALFLLLLALTACVSMEDRQAAVVKRASFDMNCPEQKIKITKLQNDGSTMKFGAEGCGKKLVYDNIRTNVYAEGAAPSEVVVNNNNYTIKPTPTPIAPITPLPPIGPAHLGYR